MDGGARWRRMYFSVGVVRVAIVVVLPPDPKPPSRTANLQTNRCRTAERVFARAAAAVVVGGGGTLVLFSIPKCLCFRKKTQRLKIRLLRLSWRRR